MVNRTGQTVLASVEELLTAMRDFRPSQRWWCQHASLLQRLSKRAEIKLERMLPKPSQELPQHTVGLHRYSISDRGSGLVAALVQL